jgi:hypothetical protein
MDLFDSSLVEEEEDYTNRSPWFMFTCYFNMLPRAGNNEAGRGKGWMAPVVVVSHNNNKLPL